MLQGKGGVGKSFVAVHLAQYFADRGLPTAVFDSDPLTPTLSNYEALAARYINFMLEDDELDVAQFDVLANEIVEASGHIVVLDTGSSNFIPLMGYLRSNDVLRVFSELGRHVVIHSVLVGGAGARETLGGLVSMVENLPADGYVAWLNSFLGPVLFDGKPFEETKAFGEIKDRLIGIVRIKHRRGTNQMLHLKALQEMTRRHLTYKEAMATAQFSLWDRQRLAEARREVYQQLSAICGLEALVAKPVGEG
ncbi:MAG TPA: P-loop NTPase [Burkholderiaceae bacterium]|nr:P-loop NTPase [Burkholderiaceae bacterium]